MSADNWTKCPKCSIDYAESVKNWEQKVKESYGVLPEEKYLQLKGAKPENSSKDTLREDYYIGIDDGEFSIDYSASCQKCDYRKVYKYTEKIK